MDQANNTLQYVHRYLQARNLEQEQSRNQTKTFIQPDLSVIQSPGNQSYQDSQLLLSEVKRTTRNSTWNWEECWERSKTNSFSNFSNLYWRTLWAIIRKAWSRESLKLFRESLKRNSQSKLRITISFSKDMNSIIKSDSWWLICSTT